MGQKIIGGSQLCPSIMSHGYTVKVVRRFALKRSLRHTYFLDGVLLFSSGYPGTTYIDQAAPCLLGARIKGLCHHTQHESRDYRDHSAVKGTGSSSRRPGFISSTYIAAHSVHSSTSAGPAPSSVLHRHHVYNWYTDMQAKSPYT